jgi:hypothetical protein
LTRTRTLIAIAFALLSALLIAACGGGGNNEDPRAVLRETFNNPTPIQSGIFDLDLKIETSGGSSPGKLEAKLGGRFQNRGPDQFPQFDFDVSLHGEGGSQSFSGSGGLTSTGERAFVKFQGTEYAVPQALYDQFVTTYAQLQGQKRSNRSTGLLQSLGINVSNWVTDLHNDGIEDVEGTNTIHISGKANAAYNQRQNDVYGALLDSVYIHSAEFDQLKSAVESADVDVNTGETDKLLRRLQLDFELKPPPGTPGAPDSVSVFFQLNLADVNKPQKIQAPASSQPLRSLLDRYGIDLGNLGRLRGGLGTSGALPESGGSTKAPSASATQRYQQCLQQASGVAELQRCAAILGQ